MARIPRPEVSEIPLDGTATTRGAQLRSLGFNAGNPNVPPGGSAEARALRPVATPAPPPTPAQPAPYRAGFAAGTAVRAALPTATAGTAGAAAAGTVNRLRQQSLDDAAPFVAPPTAPGQIPGADPRYQAPPAAAGSFLNQSELGRNFGNAVMAIPGGSGATRALTNTAQMATRTAPATRLAATAPIVAAGSRGYATGDATMPGTPGVAPAPSSVAADYSNEGRNYPAAGAALRMPTDNTGKIVRSGNSYSGADVKFGADIVTPDGALVNGGDPNKPKGFGVTSLDTSAGYQSDVRELGRLRAERAEREAGFAANQPGGGLSGISGRTVVDDVVARGNAGGRSAAGESGLSARQRAGLRMQEAEIAQRGGIAAMQNNATLRGQDIGANSSRYSADSSARSSRYAADTDYAEKIDARRMDLAAKQAERLRIAEAWKGTADPAVAARRLAASGRDPSKALSIASDARAATEATGKDVDRTVESLSTTVDKNGAAQISPGAVAQNRALLTNIAPGYAMASPEVRREQQPLIFGSMQAVNGMNALRGDNTLDQLFGRQPDVMTSMPDVSGAEISQLGYTDVLPWSKRSVGDTRLRLRDGSEQYIPRALMDENTRAALKANGARLAKE